MRPAARFFRMYFLGLGVLDGWRGRPAAERSAPIGLADYGAVFHQALAETLADRRAFAQIAEQAIELLARR